MLTTTAGRTKLPAFRLIVVCGTNLIDSCRNMLFPGRMFQSYRFIRSETFVVEMGPKNAMLSCRISLLIFTFLRVPCRCFVADNERGETSRRAAPIRLHLRQGSQGR